MKLEESHERQPAFGEVQAPGRACDLARRLFGAQSALLVLHSAGVSRVIASSGTRQPYRSRQLDFSIAPYARDAEVVQPDASGEPHYQPIATLLGLPRLGFFLRTPVVVAAAYHLALLIGDPEPGKRPTPAKRKLLDNIKALIREEFSRHAPLLTDPSAGVTAAITLDTASQLVADCTMPAALLKADQTILAANQPMASLLDRPLDSIVGRRHSELAVPMGEAISALYRHAIESRISPPDCEVVTETESGRESFQLSISPFSPIETRDYFLFVTVADTASSNALEASITRQVESDMARPREPSLAFLDETLVHRRTIRARNGVHYLTLRSWRTSLRDWQIKALRALKANTPSDMPSMIAEEMRYEMSALIGAQAFRAVVPIPCGHSGEGPCLSLEIARALGAKLDIPVIQAFVTQPLRGKSHPKENLRRPPLALIRSFEGPLLLVDDVATSGSHLEEAVKLLRPQSGSVFAVAWISGDAA
ncbi:MAG TPA: PAS domain-containing protein [Beijerinckiaceae bacterium]|nr:PAS domain-containing protein [Beijerinckiaceae bacterium]